eukprot:s2799_g2.t1
MATGDASDAAETALSELCGQVPPSHGDQLKALASTLRWLTSMAKQPFEEVPAGLQALWRQAASTLGEATCKAADLLMVANDASPRADQLLHSMLQSWNRQLLALQPGGSAILPLAWPGEGGRQAGCRLAALAVLRRTSAEEGRLALVNLGGSGSEYHLQELQGPPSWPVRCTAPVVVTRVPWSRLCSSVFWLFALRPALAGDCPDPHPALLYEVLLPFLTKEERGTQLKRQLTDTGWGCRWCPMPRSDDTKVHATFEVESWGAESQLTPQPFRAVIQSNVSST